MPHFIAVKIHYDHRESLAPHLKYSTPPTPDQYNEYLKLFRTEGIGGNGFHECLNFAIPESGNVQIYLPPTCLPAKNKTDDEFIVFSFTYKGDKDLSANIVGLHAGTRILSVDGYGIPREDIENVEGIEPMHYHAEAPADLVTLLVPPLPYDHQDGIFTPKYQNLGYGLRYLTEEHAQNIVNASLESARLELKRSSISQRTVIERQIEVLERVNERYFKASRAGLVTPPKSSKPTLPNKDIGYLGEKLIYERELEYVKSINLAASEVEWVSQSAPTSPFDIKTIRELNGGYRDHYIEVKSSTALDDVSIYISSGQIDFFEEAQENGSFTFVQFDRERQHVSTRDLSIKEIKEEFELSPIKYKVSKKKS
ncbi:protein NO VEIN domain-containing protein [Metapseudomonas resinovorans]|uniref:protein NO VEIN domain-containing protein n=1 Tax=Metapseudomonas resinovorans TaxID=53412 RepID=UPI00138AFBAB|nr:DUF3883 domain-containing protein [Pseudomonas resinovorans]MDE3736672.1 DUF3883 domain-containing protein [Pseudomonas resinovorans]